jgi:hypothetical protein
MLLWIVSDRFNISLLRGVHFSSYLCFKFYFVKDRILLQSFYIVYQTVLTIMEQNSTFNWYCLL